MKLKSKKSALLLSFTSLLLCFAMLAGSTFAWFTDTATTGVNQIKSGTLDVQLLDTSGNSLEGKTLEWQKKKTGTETEADAQILWEPGCTYNLTPFVIKNNGNLALKYKIAITGITGSSKLLEALEFTYKIGNSTLDLTQEAQLLPGASTGEITITGYMKKEAGNEYQNKSIDGIAITVYATQLNSEFDSFNNTYDKDAEYVMRNATIMSETDGKTFTLEAGKTYTVGSATVKVSANGDITYTNTDGTAQTVTINTEGGKLTVNAPNDTVNHHGEAEFVEITAIAGNSYHEFGKVSVLAITEGRAVIENGNNAAITQLKGADALVVVREGVTLETKLEQASGVTAKVGVINADGNAIEGKTVDVKADVENVPAELEEVLGSGKTIDEAKDYVAMIGTDGYESLADAVAAAQDGATIKLLKSTESARINLENKSIVVDLNGKTLTSTGAYGVMFCAKNGNKITVNGAVAGSKLVGTLMITSGTDGHIEVNGGTIESSQYCPIYINGSVSTEASTLKVKNADLVALPGNSDQDNGCGVYLAGYATSTFENTTIEAPVTAMEIRAGKLDLKNCTLIGGNGAVETAANGNGSTVMNAALAVSQHNTKKPIAVTIDGGSYTATAAVYQTDVQGTGSEDVKVTINSGTFNGKVSAETDGTIEVKDGSFTDLANAIKYAADGATIGLAEDIDLSADYWTPLDLAKELTIDGNNHVISGLKTQAGILAPKEGSVPGDGHNCYYYAGFIGRNTKPLTVKNLTFKNANVEITSPEGVEENGSSSLAVVCGYNGAAITIENVVIDNCRVAGMQKIGGFVGQGHAKQVTIRNSMVKDSTFEGYFFVAPIAAYADSTKFTVENVIASNNTLKMSFNTDDSEVKDEAGNIYSANYKMLIGCQSAIIVDRTTVINGESYDYGAY